MAGTDADMPLKWWVRGAVALVLAIAAVDWLGWATGAPSLAQVHLHWPQMVPWSTSILAGLAVAILLQAGRPSAGRIWTGRALALTAGTLAAVFLAEYVTGSPFGLDRVLFPGAVGALDQAWPGRPSVQAALSILALAATVGLLRLDRRWIVIGWPFVTIAAAALPLVALVTYLFDAAEMLSRSPSVGMNASTAVAIMLLIGAAVAVRPDRQPVAWLVARPDRRMLVRLVVTFLLVPVWVAIWRLVLLAFGLHGDAVWVLSVTLATLILGAPIFLISRHVQHVTADQLTQSRVRTEAERQRAEAVERYRILADNAVDVVVHLRGRHIAWVSPSVQAAFANPPERWVGSDFTDHVHPDDLETMDSLLNRIGAGKSVTERFRIRSADGSYHWVDGHATSYLDATAAPDGVILALRIVDTQVEVEHELQQALDFAITLAGEKSDYVATVSHEIRSPIHAILGFAELLETQLSAEGRNEAAEWSRRIRTEAERLSRLISDLLDLSRLDAGRTTIAAEPFQLRAMVDDVVQMSKLKVEAQGLKLDYSVDPTIPDWRTGDPDRLHQVLHNLVSNAEKFTREGRIDVDVSPASTGTNADLVRFAVTDTGPGIPGEDIARILQPFTQVRSSDAERGSGLGLAISDRLVKAMGGDGLDVASLEGHGSTFHFTVPLPESEPQQQAAEAVKTTETGSRRRVLVADDNQTNRLLVAAQLDKLGYDCDVASDGAEALKRLESGTFDAVLMDCNMPGMDGYEATRRIRAGERGTGVHIPVLALTASAVDSNRDACERAGMDSFLGKPLSLSKLAEELGRFIGAGRPENADADTSSDTQTTTEAPILDEARIDRLLEELGADPLHKVVSAFVAEMPRRLAELRRVAVQRDADAVRRSAHALRSPSAMLGAVALADQLRIFEESADPLSAMAAIPETSLDGLIETSVERLQARLGQPADQGGKP